jgi:hypothetical protein
MENILAQHPDFLLALGEGVTSRRVEAVRDLIGRLETEGAGAMPPAGLLAKGVDRLRRSGGRFRRRLGDLLLRREQVLSARKIVDEMEALIV